MKICTKRNFTKQFCCLKTTSVAPSWIIDPKTTLVFLKQFLPFSRPFRGPDKMDDEDGDGSGVIRITAFVFSAPKNLDRRNAIRNTWGEELLQTTKVEQGKTAAAAAATGNNVIFILGRSEDEKIQVGAKKMFFLTILRT